MVPIWFSHHKDIERLQQAWQTEFEKRATGGAIALSGFHYQFLIALHDMLRAWLNGSATDRGRPKVLTECLSDILDKSSNDIILVTQVKRVTRSDSFRDALNELWLIYHLATQITPDLVPYLRFRVLSTKSVLTDYEKALNHWHPADQPPSSRAIGVFRERVTVELFSDPRDEVLALLANNLRAQDPTGYVQRWLGVLLAAASKEDTSGFEDAGHSIWNDLQSIENSSLTPSQSIYVWTSKDRTPLKITEGNVLTGERPQVHHLREGYFAPRTEVYQAIADQAHEWALEVRNNLDRQVRLPVFWIGGRSGSGKSVALIHVLALLYESGLGPILWLGNKTELLRTAVPWALKLAAKNRPVMIGIDDPYAPNTQGDDIVWMEALATLEGIRQGGDASALPLILCCGPSEQAQRMQRDLPEEVNVSLTELPEEDRKDVLHLRSWYVQRTRKSPPTVGDENVLLVQLFFEWETGQALPAFALRFRNRIREADPTEALENVVSRMLCVNRLYVGYPTKAIRAYLTPDLQDTFNRLREEHHIAQTLSDRGIGLWLAHPHLSNLIYESWYPLQSSRAVRADHLFRVIEDSIEYGSSASEKMAPLWAISNATFSSTKQNPAVGRLDQNMIFEVLPSVYESRTQDIGKPLSLRELPVWIQIQALSPNLALRPNPISEGLNQIRLKNLNEGGLRLTCQKLLQHRNSIPGPQRSRVIDSIVQLLTDAPHWYEWAPVADSTYRQTNDPRMVEPIVEWVIAHPFSPWAATLFVPVFTNNSAEPRVLNAARYLLARVGSEFRWGDVAIQLLELSRQSIPLPVLQWAQNNFRELGACFLLGRLLRRGQDWAWKWAFAWCKLWHEERSANFVLEPLLDLVGPNEKIRDWCIRWIATDHQTVDTGFLVERLIKTFPSDREVLTMALHWLENNPLEHRSWQFVWGALFEVDRQHIANLPLWEPAANSQQNGNDKTTQNPILKLGESIPNKDPKAWFYLAIGLRKANRLEDAIAALLQAIKLDPQFADAWRLLGSIYDREGQNVLAVDASLTSVRLKPHDPEAWHQLGIMYGKLARYEDEAVALVKATELDPDSPKSWQSLSSTYNILGQNELALNAALRMVALMPDNAEAWYRLSISYGKVGRQDDRVAALIKATDLNPTFIEGWRALSAAQSQSGEKKLGIQALSKVAQLEPNNAKGWYHLGIAYGLCGNYEDEVTALTRATVIDPADASAWQALGATHNYLQHYDLALDAAIRVTELRPDDAEAWYHLGVAYGKVGRTDDKIAALQTAYNIDPNLISVYRALSDVPHDPSNTNQLALEASLKHIELQPENAEAWYYLGISYGKVGRYEDEAAALAKATELDPTLADAWLALGATYNELGQNELAVNASLKLTELTPENAEAWYWLGVAYGKFNRHPEKASALEKALDLTPDFPEALQALGATYNHLKLYDQGLSAAIRLTKLTPDDPDAWYYLGLAYGKLAQYPEEVKALLRATELGPHSMPAWQALGATYNHLAQDDLALAAAIKVTELVPDDAEAWYRLGLTYFKLKRFGDASTTLLKALELDPSLSDARRRLSDVNAKLEKTTTRDGLDTEDAKQWYNRGMSHLKTGDLGQTTNALRQAGKLATDETAAILTMLQLQMEEATTAYRDQRYDEAIKLCQVMIWIDPTLYEAWRILSSSYRRQGNHEDALDSAKHLVDLAPLDAEAWYILGLRERVVGQIREATTAFEQALQLDINFSAAWRALHKLANEIDLSA